MFLILILPTIYIYLSNISGFKCNLYELNPSRLNIMKKLTYYLSQPISKTLDSLTKCFVF